MSFFSSRNICFMLLLLILIVVPLLVAAIRDQEVPNRHDEEQRTRTNQMEAQKQNDSLITT